MVQNLSQSLRDTLVLLSFFFIVLLWNKGQFYIQLRVLYKLYARPFRYINLAWRLSSFHIPLAFPEARFFSLNLNTFFTLLLGAITSLYYIAYAVARLGTGVRLLIAANRTWSYYSVRRHLRALGAANNLKRLTLFGLFLP